MLQGYEAWNHHRFAGLFHPEIRHGLAVKGFFPDDSVRRAELEGTERRFVKELKPGTKVWICAKWIADGWVWRWISWMGTGEWVDTWTTAYVLGELAEWGLGQREPAGSSFTVRDRYKKEFTG